MMRHNHSQDKEPGNATDAVIMDGNSMTAGDICRIARGEARVLISEDAERRVRDARAAFEQIVAEGIPIYGVTTGYGEMIYVAVGHEHESELQHNLVMSHAAGVGELFSAEEVRAIVATRLNALVRGHSAVRVDIIRRLGDMLNQGIVPAVPKVGSLGASGDLATLSHIACSLIGEGYVLGAKGERTPAAAALRAKGLEPLKLRFKEGLALINGTSGMTGLGALILETAEHQLRQAEAVCALTLESQFASESPFQPSGHIARPHPGQIETAEILRQMTAGSRLMKPHRRLREEMAAERRTNTSVTSTSVHIQKAYSLRCIPQVHGAIRDTLRHARKVVETEINSSNDNPLFFDGEEVFHGANFHGQPVAFVMDFVAIAMTQLGVLTERRTNRMLNRHLSQGLPEFLVKGTPGLNSGFAGAQYPGTALIAENRTICSPASIQSVPSNGDNQDVVSMGLIAARNAQKIIDNNHYIIAIEYLCAAQSIDIRGVYDRLSPCGRATYDLIRSHVPVLEADRFMSSDLEKVATLLKARELSRALQKAMPS